MTENCRRCGEWMSGVHKCKIDKECNCPICKSRGFDWNEDETKRVCPKCGFTSSVSKKILLIKNVSKRDK